VRTALVDHIDDIADFVAHHVSQLCRYLRQGGYVFEVVCLCDRVQNIEKKDFDDIFVGVGSGLSNI